MASNTKEKKKHLKTTARADLSILHKIKEGLKGDNLEKFEVSCFGLLIKMANMKFHGQLFRHLLLNLDKKRSTNKLIFHVSKQELVFGPSEFSLITGLKFSPKTACPSSSSLYDKYFLDKKNGILYNDIARVFNDANELSEDCLKFTLLLFLYDLLLGRHKNNKKIEMKFFFLVDSLSYFNQYAWGTVVFEYLIRDICSNVHKLNTSIDLNGFIYVIQCWVFEAIPSYGRQCGVRIEHVDAKIGIPRILLWDSTHFPTFKQLGDTVFKPPSNSDLLQNNIDVHHRLQLLDDEMSSLAYQSALKWEENNCFNLKVPKVDEDGVCQPRDETQNAEDQASEPKANGDEVVHGTQHEENPNQEHSKLGSLRPCVEQLTQKVEVLQASIQKVDERQDRIEATQSIIQTMLSTVMNHLKIKMPDESLKQPNQTPDNVVHIDANPNVSSRRVEKDYLNTGNSPSPSQQYTYHWTGTGPKHANINQFTSPAPKHHTDHCNIQGSIDVNIRPFPPSYSQQRSYHFKVDNKVFVEDYTFSPNVDARGKDVECLGGNTITYK